MLTPGYETEELTFAQRSATIVMVSDGVRARKTDTGYVVEQLLSDGTWYLSGAKRWYSELHP